MAEPALLLHSSHHSSSWPPCCLWNEGDISGPTSAPCSTQQLFASTPSLGGPADQVSTAELFYSSLLFFPCFPQELKGVRQSVPSCSCSSASSRLAPFQQPVTAPLMKASIFLQLPAEILVWALSHLFQSQQQIGLPRTIPILLLYYPAQYLGQQVLAVDTAAAKGIWTSMPLGLAVSGKFPYNLPLQYVSRSQKVEIKTGS